MKKERFFFDVRLSAWVEIILFLFACFVIAEVAHISYNYIDYTLHPYLIIVILISCQYGTSAGMLAAFLCTVVFLTGPLPKQTILQEKDEYLFLIARLPLIWFVSALVLGELRMKQLRERNKLKIIADETREREKRLAESYEALKRVKERIEKHLAAEMPTVWMVVEGFQKLDETAKGEVVTKGVELIKMLIKPEKCSIYFLKGDELVLESVYGWEHDDVYLRGFGPSTPLYREVIERKRVLNILSGDEDVMAKEGILAAPILNKSNGTALGMLKIEMMPFQDVNMSTVEALRLIGIGIGKVYGR